MPDKRKSKRRNMKSFMLKEISVVDKPAQEGARMALMKRDGGDPIEVRILKHYLDNGSFAKYAVERVTKRAGDGVAKTCWPALAALDTSLRSIVRDASLDDASKVKMMKSSVTDFLTFTKQRLPDAEPHLLKVVSDAEEDEMNLSQLQKQMTALTKKIDGVVAVMQKKADADDEVVAKLSAALSDEDGKADDDVEKADDKTMAEMMADMGSTAKAHEDEMYPDEEEEETEKADDDETEPGKVTTEGEEDEPIGAGSPTPIGGGSGGKRATTKRADVNDDDVLYVGDKIVHKRAIDPDLFTLLKSQQREVEAQRAEVTRLAKAAQEERDLRELVEFAKVAEDQLQNLPGTIEEKASILKRLSKVLPQNERIILSRMLKAGDAGISKAFDSVGHRRVEKAGGDFTKRVDEVRARDNCSRTEAMQKARREYPEDYAAYQGN